MRQLKPEISLQVIIGNQLRSILQCNSLFEVRHARQVDSVDFQERTNAIANAMMVTETTMPALYNICTDIMQNLEYNEPVDFFITGNSEINAYSFYSEDNDSPHIVVINSALFNLMNEDELKFIIGHELGHLINRDSEISRQVGFIYPDEDCIIPEYVNSRIKQYNHLAEYGADRYGYLACQDLGACITAFYKLNSGIDLQKVGISIDALLEENTSKMKYIFEKMIVQEGTHPSGPNRVHALMLFDSCRSQKQLDEEMGQLLDLIPGMLLSNAEIYYIRLAIVAGYMLAEIDGKPEKRVLNHIVKVVASFYIEPTKVIKSVLKEDREQVMYEAISVLKDIEPGFLYKTLRFLIEIAMIDETISQKEIDFLVEFGQEKLEQEIEDIYEAIEDIMVEDYQSSIEGL